jgi:hypothetical protein
MKLWLLLIVQLFTVTLFAGPPVRFVQNKNQWNEKIHFVSLIPGGTMQLRDGGFSFVLLDYKRIEDVHYHSHDGTVVEEVEDPMVDGVVVNVNFIGSNPNARRVFSGQSHEYYNFFQGNNPAYWASRAYAFDSVTYLNYYEGIDMRVYSADQHAKYDLIVSPGSDPSVIQVQYDGADRMTMDNGNLYTHTKFGEIIERKPYAYQIKEGHRVDVPCEFILNGNQMHFAFPQGYDSCYELVIDPILIFSTYSGSTADNWGSTATPGEHGTLYSAGVTNQFVGEGINRQYSGTYPATAGAFQLTYGGLFDIGLLKYDSTGSRLIYASYFGGTQSESAHSLVLNKNNELLMLGTTSSANFPVTSNAYDVTYNGGTRVDHVVSYRNGSDIVIAKISPDGSQLLSSTFLGGTDNDGVNDNELNRNYGDHLRGDIISDTDGNVYITSVTSSINLAGIGGFKGGTHDAIVVKMPGSLSSITWLKYIGGVGTDAAHTIKLDPQNNIYVAGGTASPDFPVTSGAHQTSYLGLTDGWIAKLDNNGNIINATYSGSNEYDQIYFLDLNRDNEVYVYGQTRGSRPVTSGVYSDANSGQFIQKFSNDLSTQLMYTTFGSGRGEPDISPTAFMVSDCNYIYAAGWGGNINSAFFGGLNTTTTGLPVTADALQRTTAGHDLYFIVFSEDAGKRLYATFLGGEVSQTHVDGGTSRFDKSGVVYHAVCSGCRVTSSRPPTSDFPTSANAWSRNNNSKNCNNAAFKLDLSSLKAKLNMKSSSALCMPDLAEFDNLSLGGQLYKWNFGDGSVALVLANRSSVKHLYQKEGTYTVWLTAIDEGTCKVKDSVSIKVNVFDSDAQFPRDATICQGSQRVLSATGGENYVWSSKDHKYYQSGTQNTITIAPDTSTLVYIAVLESSGCVTRDSVWVRVVPELTPDFSFERTADCTEAIPELKLTNLTDSLLVGDLLVFDFGDGTTSDLDEVVHRYEEPGTYNVKLVARRDFCVWEKSVPMSFGPLYYPNVITPGQLDGNNDKFIIQFGDQSGKTPLDFGFKTDLKIFDRWGVLIYSNEDYQHDWNGASVSGGVYYFQVKVEDHSACKGWLQVIK